MIAREAEFVVVLPSQLIAVLAIIQDNCDQFPSSGATKTKAGGEVTHAWTIHINCKLTNSVMSFISYLHLGATSIDKIGEVWLSDEIGEGGLKF